MLRAVGGLVFFCVVLSLTRTSLPNRAASDPSLGAGALVAALAFGIYSMGVEWVAWVIERQDVLLGLFYVLTVWACL